MNCSIEVTQRLLNVKETAQFLNVKQGTIRYLCFTRKIPFIKVGRLVRFNLNELKLWLESNRSNVSEF